MISFKTVSVGVDEPVGITVVVDDDGGIGVY